MLAGLASAAALGAGPVQTVGEGNRDPLPLEAASAILVDADSGRVLYQKNPDEVMVPASLAKLMTLHIVYEKLEDRSISRTDVVTLSPRAWADHQVPGSTLMQLGPGQIVTVEELMMGAAIMSGNDAATALAEYVAGSTSEFVRMMNDEARFMGYHSMHFADPAGVDPGNRVTAREFADFCRRYIALHPEALTELHAQREFDYPLPQNMPGVRPWELETKKKYNGNGLVWDGIGVDGLKTGHLDDENFTAAITARRGGMRLVAVLLGSPGTSLSDGARRLSKDGLRLLTYGYRSFQPVDLDLPRLPAARVWKGAKGSVAVQASGPAHLVLRPEERDDLTYMVLQRFPLVAPVYRGQQVGNLVYSAGNEEVVRIPLLAANDVPGAGPLRWTWDSIVLGLSAMVENTQAAVVAATDSLRPTTVVAGRGQSQ